MNIRDQYDIVTERAIADMLGYPPKHDPRHLAVRRVLDSATAPSIPSTETCEDDREEEQEDDDGTRLVGDEYRNLTPNKRDPDRDYETWRDDTENHTEKW